MRNTLNFIWVPGTTQNFTRKLGVIPVDSGTNHKKGSKSSKDLLPFLKVCKSLLLKSKGRF